jgi:hypothetical protein
MLNGDFCSVALGLGDFPGWRLDGYRTWTDDHQLDRGSYVTCSLANELY